MLLFCFHCCVAFIYIAKEISERKEEEVKIRTFKETKKQQRLSSAL